MSSRVKELFRPNPLTASGTITKAGGEVGGFLCTSSTSGTLQITDGEASGGATLVAAFPVVAGTYYKLGFYLQNGAYAVMTNCAGTFGV